MSARFQTIEVATDAKAAIEIDDSKLSTQHLQQLLHCSHLHNNLKVGTGNEPFRRPLPMTFRVDIGASSSIATKYELNTQKQQT